MAGLPVVVILAGCTVLSCVFSEVYSLWMSNKIRDCFRVRLGPLGETQLLELAELGKGLGKYSSSLLSLRVHPWFQERDLLDYKMPLVPKEGNHSMRTRHPLAWPPLREKEGSGLPRLLPSLLLPWGARWKERWWRQQSQLRRWPFSHRAQCHKLLCPSRQMVLSCLYTREHDQEPHSSSMTLDKLPPLSEPFLICPHQWGEWCWYRDFVKITCDNVHMLGKLLPCKM